MNQQPLTFETRRAARSSLGSVNTDRAAIMRALSEVGAEGYTDEELQRVLDMNPSTERPRRGELVSLGLVVEAGRTRPTRSGRRAVVWIVTGEKQT